MVHMYQIIMLYMYVHKIIGARKKEKQSIIISYPNALGFQREWEQHHSDVPYHKTSH